MLVVVSVLELRTPDRFIKCEPYVFERGGVHIVPDVCIGNFNPNLFTNPFYDGFFFSGQIVGRLCPPTQQMHRWRARAAVLAGIRACPPMAECPQAGRMSAGRLGSPGESSPKVLVVSVKIS